MSDLRALTVASRSLRARGETFYIATVVAVRGSAYRKPGARLVLTPERCVAGSVSAGCIENDLVRKLGHRLRDAHHALSTYDACNGQVDIYQELAVEAPTDPLLVIERCIGSQQVGAMAVDLERGVRSAVLADGAAYGEDPSLEELCRDALRGAFRVAPGIFVERVCPPPRLFVAGVGQDAQPLVKMARMIGWEVIVYAPHASLTARERFGGADDLVFGSADELELRVGRSHRALAVVMSHDYAQDRDALGALLRSRASYIGVLGPRSRTDALLRDVGVADDPRVCAPVGLPIGAETPEEIALAILAEARARLSRPA